MTICQVCQKENPAGAEYCEDCGAALRTPAPVGAGVSGGGVSGGGSTAAGVAGTGSTAASGPAGSLASEAPGTGAGAPASTAPATVPTVPPTSSSSSAAASPTAPAGAGSNGQATPSTSSQTGGDAAPGGPPAAAGSQVQARLLVVRYGAPTGDEIPLPGQRLVVGRFDPETGPVDIDLSDSAESGHISRQHGELYREGNGSWMVRDLGSTNGVFVKSGDAASFGPRITAPRPLQDGDEVAFGNARFIFKTT
jgi:hypothetical protein